MAYDAGDLDEAERWFRQAATQSPDYVGAQGHLGWVHYARAEWEPAAEQFQRALDLGSTSLEYRYELALSLAYDGQCAKARPQMAVLIAEDPGLATVLRDGLAACP